MKKQSYYERLLRLSVDGTYYVQSARTASKRHHRMVRHYKIVRRLDEVEREQLLFVPQGKRAVA